MPHLSILSFCILFIVELSLKYQQLSTKYFANAALTKNCTHIINDLVALAAASVTVLLLFMTLLPTPTVIVCHCMLVTQRVLSAFPVVASKLFTTQFWITFTIIVVGVYGCRLPQPHIYIFRMIYICAYDILYIIYIYWIHVSPCMRLHKQ